MQFMSTTIVETWSGADLSQLGPIYPFVGSEFLLWIIGLAFWIGFHVLQARIEKKELAEDARLAGERERISRVFEEERHV